VNLPGRAAELTDFFLSEVDTLAPGLVQGLYLVGSVALGDFQAHSSDVDFVAVSEERANETEVQGLARAHEAVRSRYLGLNFDGPHLAWPDLAAGPQACPPAPFIHEGRFEPSGQYAINPVTWHELADHGVARRGPSLIGLSIWHDPAALRAWTLNNLVEYWRPWLDRYREGPAGIAQLDDPVTWGVLGVARLHCTAASGRITSKTGAGRYALGVFGEHWRRIISEALRIRLDPAAPSDYADLSERRRQVVAFMDMVISTAHEADTA
jgi:hypothetical protein